MASQFLVPSLSSQEDVLLGWLQEAVREGETFIRNQTAATDFQKAKDIIAGISQNKINKSLSNININMEKRLIRDIVATMSNLRPLWGYSTDNEELEDNSVVLNKLLMSWYQTTFADRKIKKALQYAGAFGTAFIGPDWKSDFWTRGRGDIVLKVWSPENVLPIQLPEDHDVQRAYGVTLKEEVPINLARATFPTMANKIVPDRQSPSGLKKGIGKLSSFLSPVLNRFGVDQKSRKSLDTVFPTVDIYQTYIMDLSVNEGPDVMCMGEPGTNWYYEVPVLGSMIPDGTNTAGETLFRKATVEDAMIYPFRRLITWCNSGILRDGPSFWWHGKVPIVKLCMDIWAWEFLGYSMTRDLDSIQQSSNSLRRAMDDSAGARLRPALMFDDKSMSQSLVESVDTRVPGQAVGVDFSAGERPMRPLLEAAYYDTPAWIPEMLNSNDEFMKYLSGVNDFSAIAKARQLPSSDTVEKIMEMAGPLVTDISREMEAALGELGEMLKCMFFQFYTAERRLQILGPDGITEQDNEYFKPASLVPSHLPNENRAAPPKSSNRERAKKYMDSFFFKITPNSLHQITQLTRKLLYIQLQKAGIPIDPWTMAEVMDLPNFGPPPEGTKNIMERWTAWERIKGELSAHIAANAQEIQAASQLKSAIGAQGVVQALGSGGGNPGGGGLPQPSHSPALGDNPPGRPSGFSGSPELKQKDGGTRSTITS